MRFDYIIYPRARESLDKSGISKRIADAGKAFKLPVASAIYGEDLPEYAGEAQRKLYSGMSADDRSALMTKLNYLFSKRSKVAWRTERLGEMVDEPVELEDFLVLSGWFASHVLSKKEMRSYKEWGFDSIADLLGCAGAAVFQASHNLRERALPWESTDEKGRRFVNMVTGDINADLRIHRLDITPYSTTDPIGNNVNYRPKMNADENIVCAYHSTEPNLLVALLKFVNESGLELEVLKDGAREFIASARAMGQGGGFCAEHFSPRESHCELHFVGFNDPLPCLGKKIERMPPCLSTDFGGVYVIYHDSDDIVFGFHKSGDRSLSDVGNQARFTKSDVEPMIKSLMHQAARGLGRTSAKQLVDLLEYRFSPRFHEDRRDE